MNSVHPAFSRAGLKSASLCPSSPRPEPTVTSHRLPLALSLLACVMLGGAAKVFAMPSRIEDESSSVNLQARVAAISGLMRLAQTQPSQPPAPQTPAAPAADAAAPADDAEPIGNVVTLTGVATVIRNKD